MGGKGWCMAVKKLDNQQVIDAFYKQWDKLVDRENTFKLQPDEKWLVETVIGWICMNYKVVDEQELFFDQRASGI